MKTAFDLVTAAKKRIREIPLTQAEAIIRDADLLIDVRDKEEYEAGHIPGAIHISRGMLEFKLSTDSALSRRDLKLVLYCKTSGRAALSAASLLEMGYQNVYSLVGGFEAWSDTGRPVSRPEVPRFE